MENQTTASGEGYSLICGMGRTPMTRHEVATWCERTGKTSAANTQHPADDAAQESLTRAA